MTPSPQSDGPLMPTKTSLLAGQVICGYRLLNFCHKN